MYIYCYTKMQVSQSKLVQISLAPWPRSAAAEICYQLADDHFYDTHAHAETMGTGEVRVAVSRVDTAHALNTYTHARKTRAKEKEAYRQREAQREDT